MWQESGRLEIFPGPIFLRNPLTIMESRRRGSNPRPIDYESIALPLCYFGVERGFVNFRSGAKGRVDSSNDRRPSQCQNQQR